MQRLSRHLLATTACVALVAVFAGSAAAHAGLEGSNPKNGGTAKTTIKAAWLLFGEPRRSGTASVKGPSGADVVAGKAGVDPRNVDRLLIPLKRGLKPGAYVLSASTVAADGHKQTWTINFTLRK